MTSPAPAADRELDARHLICPMPVLRARKALLAMAPGEVLLLRATDRAALRDVPAFCAATGHQLVGQAQAGQAAAAELRFWIRKLGPAATRQAVGERESP